MRVFQIEGDWGMDHLKLSTRPEPKAGPGQVVVKMTASSLNYRDLVVPNRGYGNHTGTLPLIPVSDGVGVVSAIAPGVTRVAVGDRVCHTFFQNWISGEPDLERLTRSLGGPIDGTMTDYMCLPEEGVTKVPAHLSDLEAATLPCAALTAWSALVNCGNIRPGDRVLTLDEQAPEGAHMRLRSCEVTAIFAHAPESVCEVMLTGGGKFRVTPNHRLLVNGEIGRAHV